MNTITIPIQQDQTLAEALKLAGYPNIPTNVILNKVLTGIGATYMEIKAERNSIIIEPNVPVIVCKTKDHKDTIGVFKGGASDNKIEEYMCNPSIKYKKLITTPESFSRIKKAADKLNINIFTDYFCLFDECEKIAQEIDFRENIIFPIDDFFMFDQKAFVSATPKIINHDEVKKDFSILKIDPKFEYKIPIKIITTDKINNTFLNYFDTLKDSKCICVFYNTVTGINKLIQLLALQPDEYTVFCSIKSVEKLAVSGVSAIDDFDSGLMRKYNFFTCRYFSAVDMITVHCPDIVMISNINEAKHSMIDPESEAIQIQGRFRNKYGNNNRFNSICHISNFLGFDFQTEDEVLEQFEEWKKTFLHLQTRYNETTKRNVKRAIESDFKKSSIYTYLLSKSLNDKHRVNYFSVVNKYMIERLKFCYSSVQNLLETYSNTDFFIPELVDEIDHSFNFNPTNDIINNLKNPNLSDKERIKNIITQLNNGTEPQTILDLLRDYNSTSIFKFTQDIIKAYKTFGVEYFQTKTINTIRKNLLEYEKLTLSKNRLESKEFYQAIVSKFSDKMHIPMPKSECKAMLNDVYKSFNILNDKGKPFSCTNETIKNYYDLTFDNRAGINTVRLNAVLPHIQKKISE
jgi:hypothetical protein